jgi:hypothetical protein
MEASDVTASEATQEGTSPEYVDLNEASDADLAAFLENADKAESQPSVEQQPEEPQKQDEQKAEPLKDEPKVEPEQPKETVSKRDFEAVVKQLQGLELLTKRRTSEIAELRKQFREYVDQNSQGLDEKFLESPTQALKQVKEIEMAQQKIQELDAEEQALTNAHQAQVLLTHHLGGEQFDAQAVGEVLAADGMPNEFISHFLQNPYQAALPETLIQLAKRASAERKVKQMEAALQQLVPYTQKLLEERKSLPQNVLKNVQSALKQTPQVTASAGGTGQIAQRNVDPAKMSDAELAELLGL